MCQFFTLEGTTWETWIEWASHMHRWMIQPLVYRGTFPSPRYIRYLNMPDVPMTETVRRPPDHALSPHLYLQLPRGLWRLYDRRDLYIGVDDEIQTHAGEAHRFSNENNGLLSSWAFPA